MPNWCANSLKLVATTAKSEKKLSEIVYELARAQSVGESANIFNLIKPIPEALRITAGWLGKDTPEQAELEAREQLNLTLYGYKNWYEFCTGEWGTKWDAKTDDDEPFKIDGNQVTIQFDTAWSPQWAFTTPLKIWDSKLRLPTSSKAWDTLAITQMESTNAKK